MNILMVIFVAVSGALGAVQAGANAQLVRSLGRPWSAAIVVSVITAACFVAAFLATRESPPDGAHVAGAPWWAWIGGLFGAMFVIGTVFFAQKLGSGVFTGVTVTAGILASLAIDHYAWVGFERHAANMWRLLGGALMIAGVTLVALF